MTDEIEPYNQAFDLLVKSQDDVEGLLAYAYYKRHKRAWILSFSEKMNRRPERAETMVFANGACVPDQIDRYRQQSVNALVEYASVYVEQARRDIEREAVSGRIEGAALRIERQAALWPQIRVALGSTLLSTGILIVIAIGIRLLGIDLIEVVSKISDNP